MNYTVTGSQMKEIDRDTMDRIGIPSEVLMERAALALADAASKGKRPEDTRILIVCGGGNNGGDGIAAGRILHGRGYCTTVVLAGNSAQESREHRMQREIAERLGVPMIQLGNSKLDEVLGTGVWDVIVDALFGIGLRRPIEGVYADLILALKEKQVQWGAKVVAADIPSGIHADTGEIMGVCLSADVTVTFGYGKTGLFLYPGKAYCGEVITADIGFAEESLRKAGWDGQMLEREDLRNLPERRAEGNKGSFGKVLIIAGSPGMSGASYLSALAAYRTGAGLVKILTVPENRGILQVQLPEAIVETYDTERVLPGGDFEEFLQNQCAWADVIVIGPGLGREPYVEDLAEMVFSHAYVPVILDADGLNTVADHPHLTRYFTENIIITPHMGEMARLTEISVQELKENPLQAARDYSSRHGVVCVMKDAVTITVEKDGTAYINHSGCSAMAKAGSGDVLTGVIAGLLARGMECAEGAAYGVYLHGLAGEAASEALGKNSLLAHDIADHLSHLADCCLKWE